MILDKQDKHMGCGERMYNNGHKKTGHLHVRFVDYLGFIKSHSGQLKMPLHLLWSCHVDIAGQSDTIDGLCSPLKEITAICQ